MVERFGEHETGIGWTHRPGTIGRTWNPTRGCWPVSPGCANCYACRQGARFCGKGKPFDGLVKLTKGGPPKWTGEGAFVEDKLDEPFSWREPSTVFVDSMSDLFFEAFTFEQIAAVFAVMALTPQHTYQILTKRPARALEFFKWLRANAWGEKINEAFDRYVKPQRSERYWYAALRLDPYAPVCNPNVVDLDFPFPNVWIGVSAENQECYDERLPYPAGDSGGREVPLARAPAGSDRSRSRDVRGLRWHRRPLRAGRRAHGHERGVRGRLRDGRERHHGWWNRQGVLDNGVSWVIVGAESGPRARECELEWVRDIVKQCDDAGVAVFVKQLVETVVEHDEDPREVGYPSGPPPITPVFCGPGSRRKGRGFGGDVIEGPYLDGQQRLAFPEAEADA